MILVATMVQFAASRYLQVFDRRSILPWNSAYEKDTWYRRSLGALDKKGLEIVKYMGTYDSERFKKECNEDGIDQKTCRLIYTVMMGIIKIPQT